MISVQKALAKVLETAQIIGVESVSIHEAIGRTLAEDVYADREMPPFDRVTMDGICINYDAYESGQRIFKVESIAAAGSPTQTLSDPKQCIEIMTGAPLAIGADTVIRYEDLEKIDESYKIVEPIIRGKNVHARGSDHSKGKVLLQKRNRIKAIDINVLASVGKPLVEVYQNPRVAVISSGDELVEVESTPADYQIRKSNVYMIQSRSIEQADDGRFFATVQHGNGSGDMVSPTKMDGFIELTRGKEVYEVGGVYDFMWF